MYIGKIPATGAFQKCDAISVVNGQAAYTLQVGSANVSPESVNHMIVSLNGVIQVPTTAYTVAGAVLTFDSNLATGDVIDFVLLLGNVLDIGTPSDNTVATAKIQDDAVTLAKMASGTDGNIISYDASGNPVAIATGTSGHFLKSQGAGAQPVFAAAGGGKIGQVVSATSTTETTVSSTSFTIAGGMTVAITPAATSSKILIVASCGTFTTSGYASYFTLYRDAENLGNGTTGMVNNHGYGNHLTNEITLTYLDSPSSTSEIDYAFYGRTNNASYPIKMCNSAATGSITVFEVLA